MTGTGLSIINIILYIFLTMGIAGEWQGKLMVASRRYWWWISYPTVVLHGWLLYKWIDIGSGQNLSFFNMLSLTIWVIVVLMISTTLRKPIENLGIFIFPLAALSIFLVLCFPGQHILFTKAKPYELWHILLAVLTASLILLAGLQAILLAIQARQLRSKSSSRVWQNFPPLETMELLLFEMIWLVFILLTIVIITSWIFFRYQLAEVSMQKMLLVILAWLIFISLLFGRYYFGWRGRKAIYGTLLGMTILLFVYFGSQLLTGWLL